MTPLKAPSMITNINHPPSFKEGVRVLLLMLRAKDGGSAKTDRRATKKIITKSPAEFDEALEELRSLWTTDQRIYSTINTCNIENAIRIFKYRQLDADWFADEDRHNFYLDLENRWISCLKSPQATKGSLFMFDFDNDMPEKTKLFRDFHIPTSNFDVVDTYATRNGHHVITTPFNPQLVVPEVRTILMKNALMLWSY